MRRVDHCVFKTDSAFHLNPNTGHHKTVFHTKEQKIKTGSDPYLVLVSPARFDALIRAMLTLFAAIPLLVPVLILFELQPANPSRVRSRSKFQVLTIFVSTLIASASCSIFTKARKQEVFTATAAYCGGLRQHFAGHACLKRKLVKMTSATEHQLGHRRSRDTSFVICIHALWGPGDAFPTVPFVSSILLWLSTLSNCICFSSSFVRSY